MRKILLALIILLLNPSFVQAEVAEFKFSNEVALNMVRGEISAPIETTRFQDDQVTGTLTVDLADITQSRGEIKVDLLAIQSHSFSHEGKNTKQTEHMKNWFEIGPDVSEAVRAKNRWAVFNIKQVSKKSETQGSKDEIGTPIIYQVTAQGELTIHGITKPKTADLTVVIYDVDPAGQRYKDAKRVALIKTHSPLKVSLKEHGVMPRDTTGKFLEKALSAVGLKIADTAEISFDLRVYQAK